MHRDDIEKAKWFRRQVEQRPLAEDREPWERQPQESRQAYAAFADYRDMGPHARSLQKVGQQLSKSLALMKRWSAQWRWGDRTEAFDHEQDRERRAKLAEEQEKMLERHRRVASALVTTGLRRLIGDEEKSIPALPVGALDPDEVVKILSEGVRMERLTYELPTEHAKITGKVGGTAPAADGEFIRRLLGDPEATLLAARLLERVHANGAREDDAGGMGDPRE